MSLMLSERSGTGVRKQWPLPSSTAAIEVELFHVSGIRGLEDERSSELVVKVHLRYFLC